MTTDKPDARTRAILDYLTAEAVPALEAAGIPRDRAWTVALRGVIDRIEGRIRVRRRGNRLIVTDRGNTYHLPTGATI